MKPLVEFRVDGQPLPKQSFRALKSGGGYRDPRISAWQSRVAGEARITMQGREILSGPLFVEITFWRKDSSRVDGDNLSKAVLDSMSGIVYRDDQQVVDLFVHKRVDRENPGIVVEVYPALSD